MDDEDCCPLCISPFTAHDKQFHPCSCCSFRLCVWCWHRIVTLADSGNGECPGCRTPYDLEAVRKQRVHITQPPPRKAAASRQAIADVVILDKKVLLVENMPLAIMEAAGSREEDRLFTLRQHFLFGQYGRLVSAVVMRGPLRGNSVSKVEGAVEAYHCALRFSTVEEAAAALQGANGMSLCGHVLTAALTPTRYCNSLLMNRPCKKVGCVELHQVCPGDKSMIVKGAVARTLSVLGPIAKEQMTNLAATHSTWSKESVALAAGDYQGAALALVHRCLTGPPSTGPLHGGSVLLSPLDVVRSEVQRMDGGQEVSPMVPALSSSFTQSPLMQAASSTTSFTSEPLLLTPSPSSSFLQRGQGSLGRIESCMKQLVMEAAECQQALLAAERHRNQKRRRPAAGELPILPPHTPATVAGLALPHPTRRK